MSSDRSRDTAVAEAIKAIALSGQRALDIRCRRLESLPPQLFTLTHLTVLNIDSNDLTDIPSGIGALIQLTELRASDMSLQRVCDEIGLLQQLEVLELHRNRMEQLPAALCSLRALRRLTLHTNELAVLPRGIGQLVNLTALTLGSNSLSAVPDSIGQLTALTSLHMGKNHFRALPASFGNLTALTDLDMEYCDLQEFPVQIATLAQLKTLSLSENPIRAIPNDVFARLTALEKLYLDACDLAAVPSVMGSTRLKEISLESNGLCEVPAWMGELPLLEELNLGENQISSSALPDQFPRHLTSLTWLNLGKNRLTTIPDFTGMRRLREVGLNNNLVTEIPSADVLAMWRSNVVFRIELRENLIEFLPDYAVGCPAVQSLFALFPNEILPKLYLSGADVSRYKPGLNRCHITHILNAATQTEGGYYPESYTYKILGAYDQLNQSMSRFFEETNLFIDEAIAGNGAVLVHCLAGVSRVCFN
eukprot:TRINITY_DN3287_c0_g2_i2.p1 TRINITY_DN3287_c0_g2~~TRINITY_DN3287_c0_g2_i2.p1  ORF type:complete len:478 (+),score=109.36 TRINITY_DN3287_c0_g2_i2:89-1522(+)